MAKEQQPGNQTPNTPDFRESDLQRMGVDELRDKARDMGVSGTSKMHKDELVREVGQPVKSTGDQQKPRGGAGASGGNRAEASSGREQPGNQTPNTPDFRESDLQGMGVDELRDKAREMGVSGTSNMHKDELVSAVARAVRSTAG